MNRKSILDRLEVLIKAREKATEQASNHRNQVSGVWSIDGREFCEKYDLDYKAVVYAQDEQNREDFYDFVYERKKQYYDITGDKEIPAEVEDKIWDKAEAEFYFDTEATAFWDDVVEQLSQAIDEIKEERK